MDFWESVEEDNETLRKMEEGWHPNPVQEQTRRFKNSKQKEEVQKKVDPPVYLHWNEMAPPPLFFNTPSFDKVQEYALNFFAIELLPSDFEKHWPCEDKDYKSGKKVHPHFQIFADCMYNTARFMTKLSDYEKCICYLMVLKVRERMTLRLQLKQDICKK
jgi:hypothetical protein